MVNHLATLDCLFSLAAVAKQENYIRPIITDTEAEINIQQGRHPVVDGFLNGQFVPNDVYLKVCFQRNCLSFILFI